MLRIVHDNRGCGTTLHLEGQLIGPWVDELQRIADPILAAGAPLSLDLSSVSFVSREGVRLLWTLRGAQAVLLNCSRFVAEQLKAGVEARA